MTFDDASRAGLFDDVAPDAASLIEACKRWIVKEGSTTRDDRDGAPRRWIGRPEVAAGVLSALDGVRSELPDAAPARAVAECVDAGLTKGWHAAIETEQARLVGLRHLPEAKGALKAFFEKNARS